MASETIVTQASARVGRYRWAVVAMLFAATHPDRTQALITLGGDGTLTFADGGTNSLHGAGSYIPHRENTAHARLEPER